MPRSKRRDKHNFNGTSKLSLAPPPCFNFLACKGTAEACKSGRSLCRKCLDAKPGVVEYPLRVPLQGKVLQIDYALEMFGAHPRV